MFDSFRSLSTLENAESLVVSGVKEKLCEKKDKREIKPQEEYGSTTHILRDYYVNNTVDHKENLKGNLKS